MNGLFRPRVPEFQIYPFAFPFLIFLTSTFKILATMCDTQESSAGKRNGINGHFLDNRLNIKKTKRDTGRKASALSVITSGNAGIQWGS